MRVVGPIEVQLHVATTGRDTDFTAKLVDVYPLGGDYPGGFDLNISDAIARLSYRNDRPVRALAQAHIEELDEKLKQMIDYDGPVIFDCVVDKNENCYPMIPSGAAHDEMILADAQDQPGVTEAGRQMV